MKLIKVYTLTEDQLYEIFRAGFIASQSKQDCETVFVTKTRYMYPFIHKEKNSHLNPNNYDRKFVKPTTINVVRCY